MATILVSSCLLGLPTRYDGKSMPCEEIISLIKEHTLIPVCPEQAGGLPTPRVPSERTGDKVMTKDGRDVTAEYARGADIAEDLARMYKADLAILKANSPSCGYGMIYDGSFNGGKCEGNGVTADRITGLGIPVFREDQIEEIKEFLNRVSS